jgi:hypothetical protein
VRHDRAFFSEAFDMLSFFREITQRNEEREISVAMTGRAKEDIELPLHVFPNPKAPRANDHAAANIRRLRQFSRANDLLIPLWEILFSRGRDGGFFGFGHDFTCYLTSRSSLDLRRE